MFFSKLWLDGKTNDTTVTVIKIPNLYKKHWKTKIYKNIVTYIIGILMSIRWKYVEISLGTPHTHIVK